MTSKAFLWARVEAAFDVVSSTCSISLLMHTALAVRSPETWPEAGVTWLLRAVFLDALPQGLKCCSKICLFLKKNLYRLCVWKTEIPNSCVVKMSFCHIQSRESEGLGNLYLSHFVGMPLSFTHNRHGCFSWHYSFLELIKLLHAIEICATFKKCSCFFIYERGRKKQHCVLSPSLPEL